MIRQQIGDLLEIHYEGKYSYVVVLTKIVMFGGNIVFAFHTDGRRHKLQDLLANQNGFNVCTDLLLPKREGEVIRLHHFEDVTRYWRTRFAKGTVEFRSGVKAKEWFIYRIDQLERGHIARVGELNAEHRHAMDHSCYSFDIVAEKIQRSYTPDRNEHI
jgi:hypothetical protein